MNTFHQFLAQAVSAKIAFKVPERTNSKLIMALL